MKFTSNQKKDIEDWVKNVVEVQLSVPSSSSNHNSSFTVKNRSFTINIMSIEVK